MKPIELMQWAQLRLTSLPIALVIYQATAKMSSTKEGHLGAMEHLFKNPTDAEFSLLVKLAFMLPESNGLKTMFWGETEVTR